jgi:hypothetical protein
MSTAREDSNTPPPAAVLRMLKTHGFEEVELPGRQPWWQASGQAGPWEEAVDRISARAMHLEQVAALSPKRFWKTSSFWTFAVNGAGMLSVGLATLAGQLDWVPPEHRALAGTALLGISGVLGTLYVKGRLALEAVAKVEQGKLLNQGPTVPGPSSPKEVQ